MNRNAGLLARPRFNNGQRTQQVLPSACFNYTRNDEETTIKSMDGLSELLEYKSFDDRPLKWPPLQDTGFFCHKN